MTTLSPEHRSRRGWLGSTVVWRLQASILSVSDEDGGGHMFELLDIRELRLYVTSSRFREHYVRELRLADDSAMRINDEYARFVVWKVSSRETYRSFITALCVAIAPEEIHCRFRAGPAEASYLLTVLAMAAAIYLLAQYLVLHVGMSEADGHWLVALGCGLIRLKSPYWRSANRLIKFDPTEIPGGLLPHAIDAADARP